jgi:hypothetical protein
LENQDGSLEIKSSFAVTSFYSSTFRCSNAFFQEERQLLEEKREKIRLIQQRKINEKDLIEFKDIPQEIPVPLSLGHRVYAHICSPEVNKILQTKYKMIIFIIFRMEFLLVQLLLLIMLNILIVLYSTVKV